jgi:hypothetical protein
MVSDVPEKTAGWHFPADLFALFSLPALLMLNVILGAERTWLLMLLIGASQLVCGFLLLRHRRSSISGWFSTMIGVAACLAAIYFGLTPW